MKYLKDIICSRAPFIMLFCIVWVSFLAYDQHLRKIIIAKTISAEACSSGAHGMLGVASTIKNRLDQRNLSAYAVVTQPYQYYGLTNPNRDKIFEDSRCSKPAMWLAKNIKELPDIVNGAIFFKTPEEKKQSWHKELTVVIAGLEFYK